MPRYASTFSGELRTVALNVQLTPSERAEIERLQRARGFARLSDYARAAVLSGQAAAPLTARLPDLAAKVLAGEIARLDAELSRLGNNLNQMARRANESGQVRSEEDLAACLAEITDAAAKVRATLDRVTAP
jgi:hypothetical protein